MPLKLYNSYTKHKAVFRPLKDKVVAMYNCGPTVYDFAHIGNLRAFLFADVLRRHLEYRGYKVKQVMNITDVGHMTTDADAGEDKMALAVHREGKGPQEVARLYEKAFFEDLKTLSVKRAWKYPRASEHVGEMVKLVKRLLKRGHAYLVCEHRAKGHEGGTQGSAKSICRSASIYYDLSTFPRYGMLSGNRVEDLIPGARAEIVHEKRQPYDFALWIYKPEHFLQWKSPWGAGYPGWHLECSAMAMKYLGETLDIHTGGEDNKFPHHECEIAQSEGATGKRFVSFWMHVKHLLVDGRKMSKSLGNFYTLRDLIKKGYSPREVRYALISAHYRETLNFTMNGLNSAQAALQRIDELIDKLEQSDKPNRSDRVNRGIGKIVEKARRDFIAALDNDLNVPEALGVVFEFVRKVNNHVSRITYPRTRTSSTRGMHISQSDVDHMLALFKEFDTVLGLGIGKRKAAVIPETVRRLVYEREKARSAKDWVRSDRLRAQIAKNGYAVEDTLQGPKVKPIK